MAAGCPSSSQGSLERCRGRDFAQGHGHGRASARGAVREQTESACGAPEDRARDLESEGLAWARQGVPAAACSPSRSAPPAAARGSPAPPRAQREPRAPVRPGPRRPPWSPPHSPLTGATAPGAGAGAGAGAAAGAGARARGSPSAWAPSAAGAAPAAGCGLSTGPAHAPPRPRPSTRRGPPLAAPAGPRPRASSPRPGWPGGPPVRCLGPGGASGSGAEGGVGPGGPRGPRPVGLGGPAVGSGGGSCSVDGPDSPRNKQGPQGDRDPAEKRVEARCGLGQGPQGPTRAPHRAPRPSKLLTGAPTRPRLSLRCAAHRRGSGSGGDSPGAEPQGRWSPRGQHRRHAGTRGRRKSERLRGGGAGAGGSWRRSYRSRDAWQLRRGRWSQLKSYV